MRDRRRYGRRGLSMVVTSLMLVAAVSMMGAALMVWSNASFASQQREIADQTTDRINLIAENFIVEDVWFYTNATGSYANVTIRNTGNLAITISNIYINHTEAWNDGEIIVIDDVATIDVPKVDLGVPWEADRLQSIWVVTERGSEIKQVWKS